MENMEVGSLVRCAECLNGEPLNDGDDIAKSDVCLCLSCDQFRSMNLDRFCDAYIGKEEG